MADTDHLVNQPGIAVVHRAHLAAGVGVAAAVVAVAWFSRALQAGSVLDWVVFAVLAGIGILQLLVVRDSRAPLMLADDQGVRVRHGETWSGLRWSQIDHVEVKSPGSGPFGRLRDGRIELHPHATLEETDPGPFVVPLAATTTVRYDGLTGDLLPDLDALAGGHTPVLVLTRVETERPERPTRPDRAERRALAALAAAVPQQQEEETAEVEPEAQPAPEPTPTPEPEPEVQEEFDPVEPVREARPAARAEITRESVRRLPDPPTIPAQRAGGGPVVVARLDDTDDTDDAVSAVPAVSLGASHPVPDPVIGPQISAARARARLSIDELSERTRIRPHVLESIEVDDFEPCGGDFYARGHVRTLARIFGLDAEELLGLFDERYAHAEIEARQVFEAELATGIGGGVRATHSGPRWSLLAASVVLLAAVWGGAQLFSDTPQELVSPAPGVVDSAGLAQAEPSGEPTTSLATLEVTAGGSDSQVVVRDRDGRILWAGKLAQSQRQQVIGLAPFDVTASNGGAVKVAYLGKPKGTVGDGSAAANRQFG